MTVVLGTKKHLSHQRYWNRLYTVPYLLIKEVLVVKLIAPNQLRKTSTGIEVVKQYIQQSEQNFI